MPGSGSWVSEPAAATGTGSAPPSDAPRRANRTRLLRPLALHIARSLARTAVILWLVATVTFLAIRALPGNPVDVWIQDKQNSGLTAEQARTQATQLLKINVNEPLWSQYAHYMRNLSHGDLGNSIILSPGT